MSSRTAVVIVNWGAPENVESCVRSFLETGTDAADTVVVDNAHPARNSDALRSRFPGIFVLTPEANLGFAGGANAGIEWALTNGYDYVFVANNDLTVQVETLPALIDVLDTRQDIGVAGALPCYRDTGKPHFTRARINWLRGKPVIEHGEPPSSDPYETEYATGCSVLLRTDALRKAGAFDDSYFLYWEDVDLSFRLREGGYSVVMVPAATASHDVSRSTGHGSPLTVYYQTRNRLKFFSRHARAGVRPYLLIRITLSRLLKALGLMARNRRSEARGYLLGLQDFWAEALRVRPAAAQRREFSS